MWTRNELIEIRQRAEFEADVIGNSERWRCACLDLASAADRLDAMTVRIESGEEVAIASTNSTTKSGKTGSLFINFKIHGDFQ